MKLKLLTLIASLVCGELFAVVATNDDAQKVADKIFVKGENFAQTLSETRKNYESWLIAEMQQLKASGIEYGAIKQVKIDEKLSSFDVVITSKKATKAGITVGVPPHTIVSLNGEVLMDNDKWRNMDRHSFELNLKAGENLFSIKFTQSLRNNIKDYRPYVLPYADVAAKLRGKMYENRYNNYIGIFDWKKQFAIFEARDYSKILQEALDKVLERSMFSAGKFEKQLKEMRASKLPKNSYKYLELFNEMIDYYTAEKQLGYDIYNLKAAIDNLTKTYKSYPSEFAQELEKWQKEYPALKEALLKKDNSKEAKINEFKAFAKKALLADPRLKKMKTWVYIKRKFGTPHDALPANWQGNSVMKRRASWGDEIWQMQLDDPNSAKLLYKNLEETPAVTDMDIDWDAGKIMFSSLDKKENWQVYELDLSKKDEQGMPQMRMMSSGLHDGVDNYDSVYLPNGKVVFCSTACHVGVPCVGGSDYVANLYIMDPSAGSPQDVDNSVRQLTFEQDADWMPTVTNDGKVMYTRWEYTDNSHYFSRILMTMNPDGTSQASRYGSTSYWPNSIFYTRPIPNDPTKFVSIITGHHGVSRSGELHLFDTSKGTTEAQGRVHKFPSYGREYVAEVKDTLVNGKWPQILHPYPIAEDLVMISAKTPDWFFALYLVDKYDNMTLIQKGERVGLFEPMPLIKRKKPSVLPDMVSAKLKDNPKLDTGYVFLNDIYQGPGLAGVPRGEVKALRIFEYNYTYRNQGGHDVIGQEGSWDVKRIYGTVPVEEDGSAIFEVPANRPIAIQPLDKEGKALALMRSWFAVMPGETQSCVGCHEANYMAPISSTAMAARKKPSKITPFRGPVRGYSFLRDVQPILDKNCVGCHNGSKKDRPNFARGKKVWKNFTQSYMDLHPFVRRSGPESSQHLLPPAEFTANTSELVQMLKKGHYGVELDKDVWDVLYTWIDLNVPFIGSWKEAYKSVPNNGDTERRKFLAKYANRFEDPDLITWDPGEQKYVAPKAAKKHPQNPDLKAKDFPFDADEAKKKIASLRLPKNLKLPLGNGNFIHLTLIPAGSFVQGSNSGFFDEGPAKLEKVEKPFYMASLETTNAQYAAFDKNHDSDFYDKHWKDHVNLGYEANLPEQSVIRVSWNDANKFCKWLSEKTGLEVSLPTETQWEWAARAGSDSDFWFGKVGSDFSKYENMADVTTKNFAVIGIDPQPMTNPPWQMAFVPADLEFNDGKLITASVGSYLPSPFNLFDINGNVAEWTKDTYTKTLGGEKVEGEKVARGGSWRDRSKFARVTLRRNYPQWQKVYNVGFRIVVNDAQKAAKVLKQAKPIAKREFSVEHKNENKAVEETLYRSENPYDLILNGDFEYPVILNGVRGFEAKDVAGWGIDRPYRVCKGNVRNAPTLGADKKQVSQFIAIGSCNTAPYQIWQYVKIPDGVKKGVATLSFDAWAKVKQNAFVEVFVNNKKVLHEVLKGDTASWQTNTHQIKNLNANDEVKILFTELDGKGEAWHIDNVKFVIKKK